MEGRHGFGSSRPHTAASQRGELEGLGRLGSRLPGDRASELSVHDLRHTCASLWLDAGADPKVVRRILGHACAATTMDLCGHLFEHNL